MTVTEALEMCERNGHKMKEVLTETDTKLYVCDNDGCDSSLIIYETRNGEHITGSSLTHQCFSYTLFQSFLAKYKLSKMKQTYVPFDDMDTQILDCYYYIRRQYRNRKIKINPKIDLLKITGNYIQVY